MTDKVDLPTPADLNRATNLANRIAAAGRGRVRRVVLIGSRARGTAHERSDMDLVVLVEPPRGGGRWGAAEFTRERDRIQREVGSPPLPTDLSVRTTDRYEEARRVIGGVEHLIDLEGVDIYSDAFRRRPEARCSPDQVRRELAYGWVEHAVDTLDKAVRQEIAVAVRAATRPGPIPENPSARSAMLRAITGLLVFHQILSSKSDGTSGMITKLMGADPLVAAQLGAIAPSEPVFSNAAQTALGIVISRLSDDSRMAPMLQSLRRRVSAHAASELQRRADDWSLQRRAPE